MDDLGGETHRYLFVTSLKWSSLSRRFLRQSIVGGWRCGNPDGFKCDSSTGEVHRQSVTDICCPHDLNAGCVLRRFPVRNESPRGCRMVPKEPRSDTWLREGLESDEGEERGEYPQSGGDVRLPSGVDGTRSGEIGSVHKEFYLEDM